MTLAAPQTTRKPLTADKARPTRKECEEAEREREQWVKSQMEANQPRLMLD